MKESYQREGRVSVSNVRKSAGRCPLRVHPYLLLLALVLTLVAVPSGLSAEESDCPKGPPVLSPSEPVYSDAMELKQTLESHGFVVRCVFPTKLASIFEVDDGGVLHSTVEGEANFRTNYGEVDAVFMPRPETFGGFKISERRKDSGFLYIFGGTPRVWDTNRFGSARRMYFLDHGNQLFFINDVALLHRLEQAFQARHRRL
jgi:hypothetical protein